MSDQQVGQYMAAKPEWIDLEANVDQNDLITTVSDDFLFGLLCDDYSDTPTPLPANLLLSKTERGTEAPYYSSSSTNVDINAGTSLNDQVFSETYSFETLKESHSNMKSDSDTTFWGSVGSFVDVSTPMYNTLATNCNESFVNSPGTSTGNQNIHAGRPKSSFPEFPYDNGIMIGNFRQTCRGQLTVGYENTTEIRKEIKAEPVDEEPMFTTLCVDGLGLSSSPKVSSSSPFTFPVSPVKRKEAEADSINIAKTSQKQQPKKQKTITGRPAYTAKAPRSPSFSLVLNQPDAKPQTFLRSGPNPGNSPSTSFKGRFMNFDETYPEQESMAKHLTFEEQSNSSTDSCVSNGTFDDSTVDEQWSGSFKCSGNNTTATDHAGSSAKTNTVEKVLASIEMLDDAKDPSTPTEKYCPLPSSSSYVDELLKLKISNAEETRVNSTNNDRKTTVNTNSELYHQLAMPPKPIKKIPSDAQNLWKKIPVTLPRIAHHSGIMANPQKKRRKSACTDSQDPPGCAFKRPDDQKFRFFDKTGRECALGNMSPGYTTRYLEAKEKEKRMEKANIKETGSAGINKAINPNVGPTLRSQSATSTVVPVNESQGSSSENQEMKILRDLVRVLQERNMELTQEIEYLLVYRKLYYEAGHGHHTSRLNTLSSLVLKCYEQEKRNTEFDKNLIRRTMRQISEEMNADNCDVTSGEDRMKK